MNLLDLFSGIGGFRLGAKWAGMKFKNEFHSDIEPYPNKVYAKHFPNSIQLGDVAKINGHELKKQYGSEWIITGGFPCQDISIAGKGAGLSGSRSGLWFEMQRIIGELQPRYAIMENVPALTFRGLDRVLGSLADIGYDAEWTVISARDIGAPHLRKRIWIIAYPSQIGWSKDEIQTIESTKNHLKKPKEWQQLQSITSGNYYLEDKQNYLANFTRDYDGLSNELDIARIGACGNSIVPQIAELIFKLCEAKIEN